MRSLVGPQENVFVYEGDCNVVLLREVFPRTRYEAYRRALCLLDPYGLHLDWEVVRTAGQMESVEVFLNFPVMDIHMNVLWRNPDKVQESQVRRMDAFWGDASWRDVAYARTPGLFGAIEEKEDIGVVVKAYQKRLRDIAGFRFVPEPMPMRNTKGGVVYYLFFASPNEKGAKIVGDIFNKYRTRGLPNGD